MKILAIDYGEKRMGFALGNTQGKTAVPIDQLPRKNLLHDIGFIKKLLDEYEVNCVIMGYPLNMDGTENEISKKVKKFCKILKEKLKIEIKLVDERLTSFEAEEMLKTVKPNYKDRKKQIDSIAALVILQSFLDKK